MKVDRDKAIRLELAGQTHFFCSEHCLHAFQNRTEHQHGAAQSSPAAHAGSAR